jgi:hypothetical protein
VRSKIKAFKGANMAILECQNCRKQYKYSFIGWQNDKLCKACFNSENVKRKLDDKGGSQFLLPKNAICPFCEKEVELNNEGRKKGRYICSWCDEDVNIAESNLTHSGRDQLVIPEIAQRMKGVNKMSEQTSSLRGGDCLALFLAIILELTGWIMLFDSFHYVYVIMIALGLGIGIYVRESEKKPNR